MKARYGVAIAVVRTTRKPDLFITTTCNPAPRDVVAAVPEELTANVVSDVPSRVYKVKLKQLVDNLRDGLYLGDSVILGVSWAEA